MPGSDRMRAASVGLTAIAVMLAGCDRIVPPINKSETRTTPSAKVGAPPPLPEAMPMAEASPAVTEIGEGYTPADMPAPAIAPPPTVERDYASAPSPRPAPRHRARLPNNPDAEELAADRVRDEVNAQRARDAAERQ